MGEENISGLEGRIREIVAEIIEVEPEEIAPDADFVEELGMDSMQALEIMGALEKELKVKIPEEYLGKVENFKSLVNIANEILNKK